MRTLLRISLLALLPHSTTFACTLCHTDTARAIRAAVFGAHFYEHVLVSLLPFTLLVAVAMLVHGRGFSP